MSHWTHLPSQPLSSAPSITQAGHFNSASAATGHATRQGGCCMTYITFFANCGKVGVWDASRQQWCRLNKHFQLTGTPLVDFLQGCTAYSHLTADIEEEPRDKSGTLITPPKRLSSAEVAHVLKPLLSSPTRVGSTTNKPMMCAVQIRTKSRQPLSKVAIEQALQLRAQELCWSDISKQLHRSVSSLKAATHKAKLTQHSKHL